MEESHAVSFITSPALEFCSAILIMSNAEKNMVLSAETGMEPDRKLFEIGSYAAGRCSSFLQKEMHFFMDQDKWSLPHISPVNCLPFRFALAGPGAFTVDDLIRRMDSAGEGELLEILAGETFDDMEGTAKDRETFIKRLKSLPAEDEKLQEKLAECLENPAETLHRLAFDMKQFYDAVYRHFEAGILSEIEPFRAKYEKLSESDPAGFLRDYFNTDIKALQNKLQIHVSFFMQAGIISFTGTDRLPGCFIMGIHSEMRFGSRFTRAKLLNFYKLLADEKRFELFELLSERPWYVNELADRLGLAASTVSHHLGFFIRSGLVKPSRKDHRQYYALDREKVKELLERSERIFLKER